jgi:signal transduction histidine kinase
MHPSSRHVAASAASLGSSALIPFHVPDVQAWPVAITVLVLAASLLALLLLIRRGAALPRVIAAIEAAAEARLLQRLTRSRLVAVMIVDRDGQVQSASDAALDWIGHDREALAQGRLRWDAIAPGAGADAVQVVDIVRWDGTHVPTRVEVMSLAAAAGRSLVLIRDASTSLIEDDLVRARADAELARADAELAQVRTELERHKVLFDSTPVALFAKEYRGAVPGRYILANPMAAHIIGAPQVVDRTDYDLFPPEVAAMVQANDRRVIEDGVAVIVEEWAPDARTGELLCFLSTKVPLRDAAGTAYGIGGTAQDITQQKLLTDRLAALVNAIPDAWIRMDGEGRIRDVANLQRGFLAGSPEARPAVLPEALIGTTLWDLPLPAKVQQQLREVTRRVLATGKLAEIEQSLTTPDGERCYETRLVKSGSDEVVALVRDITEARRIRAELQSTNARLQAANQELREFAYVASHDLQEPLRTTASFAELLERTYGASFDDRGRRWLRNMVGGIQRMRALIDDVLAYSRVGQSGRIERVETGALVRAVLDDMQASIEATGAEVHVGELPRVVSSALELKQVFQNLISNSLKFRREGVRPRVSITAEPAEKGWTFSVSDNGIGIDPAYHDRIFLMFQRLHDRDEYPGTGIGLALVKKIVERQGGAIMLRSTLGEGTEIRFTIPARDLPGAGGR